MSDPLSETLEDQEVDLDSTSADKAEGKRSTRTTFKLSQEAIDAKEWLGSYYDISQKDLIEIALNLLEDQFIEYDDLFEAAEEGLSEKETVRKTYVVTQDTKDRFTELAERYNGVSRDALVETAIQTFKFVTEKKIESHEEILGRIEEFYDKALSLEDDLVNELGSRDPLRKGFGRIVMRIGDLKDEVDEEIENHTPIDVDLF